MDGPLGGGKCIVIIEPFQKIQFLALILFIDLSGALTVRHKQQAANHFLSDSGSPEVRSMGALLSNKLYLLLT